MDIKTIEIPQPMGVYVMVGGVKFHLTINEGRISVRCSDGGPSENGDRLFTHMPAGNQVLIETH